MYPQLEDTKLKLIFYEAIFLYYRLLCDREIILLNGISEASLASPNQ